MTKEEFESIAKRVADFIASNTDEEYNRTAEEIREHSLDDLPNLLFTYELALKEIEQLKQKLNTSQNNTKSRNELFNRMINLSPENKERLLCRLFGLMETYEEYNKHVSPKYLFSMIESIIKSEETKNNKS